MDKVRLQQAIETLVGKNLATELASDFVKIRFDVSTRTFERASPGKFVETFVQCLQHIANGTYDAKPDVEVYLTKRVENELSLPEGLRICAARAARTMYALRNKRNIAHKNEIDPNVVDLTLAYHLAAWIMAELLRNATGVSMEKAGQLIELIQTPVGTLVEEIGGVRLVHAQLSVENELLVLLHSHHPGFVPTKDVLKSMEARSAGTVKNRIGEMRLKKIVFGDSKSGYRLTSAGFLAAIREIGRVQGKMENAPLAAE